MGRTPYVPKPVDTAGVRLPANIKRLTESLARNAHEVWAAGRVRAGWRWGPDRDDDRLEHPNLVPYEALTEAEKDMDRDAVRETLKVIVALGYRIVKPDSKGAR